MQKHYSKINIMDLTMSEITEVVTSFGEKRFRGNQVFEWLHRGTFSFEEMNNIPKSLRQKLNEKYCVKIPTVLKEQTSKSDDTRKCLFEFDNTSRVESVFMKYIYGNSICISSQVGCRMGCRFCASTAKGLERNLTAGEMLAQVLMMRKITGEDIRHVVIMGIGEPFDNYDAVSHFINLINDEHGYNLGMRNITVSTCGIVPLIERFGHDFPQVNLAISLHASNGELRKKIMPIANRYGYGELLRACRRYTESTRRRITFEYALINGVNDTSTCAEELADNLRGCLTHVNLIRLNDVDGTGYRGTEKSNILKFKEILEKSGVAVTVRRTLGTDIDAACGQLRVREK